MIITGASSGLERIMTRGYAALSSILGSRAGTGDGVASYTASKGAIEQLARQ